MSKQAGIGFEVLHSTTYLEGLGRVRILEGELRRNDALLSAMAAAANVVRRAGISNLRRRLKWSRGTTGSLLLQSRVYRRKRQFAVAAGFRRPQGSHAHLVDLGSGSRYTRRGQYRGKMPANFFWSQASEQNEDKVQTAFLDAVERAITRILTK